MAEKAVSLERLKHYFAKEKEVFALKNHVHPVETQSYKKVNLKSKTTGFVKLFFTIERLGHHGIIHIIGTIDAGNYTGSMPKVVLSNSELEGYVPQYMGYHYCFGQVDTSHNTNYFSYSASLGLFFLGDVTAEQATKQISLSIPVIYKD